MAARAAGPEEAATSQPVRARRDSDPDDTTDDEPNEPLSDVSPGGTDADEPPSPRGLDPLERAMYQPMATRSPAAPATHAAPPHEGPTAPAVDALVDRFLKRFAMSGDRHRGTAALQIGSGALAGSAVTLHAEGKEVRIVVDAPEGPEVLALAARLRARLSAKGLSVSVEVGSG